LAIVRVGVVSFLAQEVGGYVERVKKSANLAIRNIVDVLDDVRALWDSLLAELVTEHRRLLTDGFEWRFHYASSGPSIFVQKRALRGAAASM
jgi:hypothetical protein